MARPGVGGMDIIHLSFSEWGRGAGWNGRALVMGRAGRYPPCCGLRLAGACCQTGSGCAEMAWRFAGVGSISIHDLDIPVSHYFPCCKGWSGYRRV